MTVTVGTQIQGGEGIWASPPTSYSYQWQSSADGLTGWADVAGSTRSDYITTTADSGLYFRVSVTATNAGGSSSVAHSAAVGPVSGSVVITTPQGRFDPGTKGIGGHGTHGKPKSDAFGGQKGGAATPGTPAAQIFDPPNNTGAN